VRRTAKRRGERRKRRECDQNRRQTASLYSPARHSAAAALSAGEHTQWPDPARARATKGASRHGVASREQWSRRCVTPIARARFVRAPRGRGQCTGRVYVPARGEDGLLQALALYSPLSYSSRLPTPSAQRNMTDFAWPLFPIVALLGTVLPLVPLTWHLQAWNSGTCYYMIWASILCLNQFVNALVWHGSAIDFAPVWCDICECIAADVPRMFCLLFMCSVPYHHRWQRRYSPRVPLHQPPPVQHRPDSRCHCHARRCQYNASSASFIVSDPFPRNVVPSSWTASSASVVLCCKSLSVRTPL
jgi:hypothetical protein